MTGEIAQNMMNWSQKFWMRTLSNTGVEYFDLDEEAERKIKRYGGNLIVLGDKAERKRIFKKAELK